MCSSPTSSSRTMQFVQTDECRRMEQLLQSLSTKHVFVKFVKCKAGDALKNYPDSQCPTLLVYRGGAVLKQFIKFDSFGGAKASVDGTCLTPTCFFSLFFCRLVETWSQGWSRRVCFVSSLFWLWSPPLWLPFAAVVVLCSCCVHCRHFLELMLTTLWPSRTCSLLFPGGRLSRYLSCCLLCLTTQMSSGSCPNWASSPRS